MRNFECLLTIMLALLVAGCSTPSLNGSGQKGSGKAGSDTRDVTGFTAVTLNGSGHLIIEQTGTESLTITADDNLLPFLTSEVRDSQLILGIKSNKSIKSTSEIVYKLTVKNLNSIELAGSGTIDANGIHTDRLKATLSGSGDINLDGQADRQEITLSGSGNFQGENLKGQTATIDLSGSGNIVLAVRAKLDVNLSGSGSIEYVGDPAVTKTVSGSGTIRKR